MADIKVDPKDGLAVQDLSTLDAAWRLERGLDRERQREREREGGPFGPGTLTRPYALERARERERERERERARASERVCARVLLLPRKAHKNLGGPTGRGALLALCGGLLAR